MNRKIESFKEGERISTPLLVTHVTKSIANNGSPYLTIQLQDNTKTIEGRYWDVKPEIEKLIESGKVYLFELEVIKYRDKFQAKISSALPMAENEYQKEDFIARSPISHATLEATINGAICRINNINIARIVTAMMNYYQKEFYSYPAASKIHHEFIGGLATHTAGMLKLAEAICDIYPALNRDYLYAGVIVHDLGKIEELSSAVVTEYTTAGKLLGHISICAARLLEIGKEIGLEDSEELLILRHLVLSHHGQLEFGSPVRPETMEAEVLSYIDNIDARINIISKALADVEEGEFSSRIFALEGRTFYKLKNNKE